MKRIGNIKENFISYDNFDLADKKARKNKSGTYGVRHFDENREDNLLKLIEQFTNNSFKSSAPKVFKLPADSGKIRDITKMPYYPDRIAHHAVMNMLEERLTKALISNTFNSIKGRGLHSLNAKIKRDLHNDVEGTQYCLKIDIKKFYQSIPCDKLKEVLCRYIKDKWFLNVVFEILDNTNGLSIGGLLSQMFSNVYVSGLDHFIKEDLKIRYYYRYADDMVILGQNKQELHAVMWMIRNYLWYNLGLELNGHRQIFKVDERGLDYVGYAFYHSHTRIRKRVKKNFIKKRKNERSVASYMGMLKWCNGRNLIYNILEKDNAKKCTD